MTTLCQHTGDTAAERVPNDHRWSRDFCQDSLRV